MSQFTEEPTDEQLELLFNEVAEQVDSKKKTPVRKAYQRLIDSGVGEEAARTMVTMVGYRSKVTQLYYDNYDETDYQRDLDRLPLLPLSMIQEMMLDVMDPAREMDELLEAPGELESFSAAVLKELSNVEEYETALAGARRRLKAGGKSAAEIERALTHVIMHEIIASEAFEVEVTHDDVLSVLNRLGTGGMDATQPETFEDN